MKERISYWLIPAEPERSLFGKIILDLSQRFDAPMFGPHVTLYSGSADDVARLDEIIVASIAGISDVVLRASGIGHSETFTKSLFVNYESNERVAGISNELKRLSAAPEDYRFEPHLSLIYADLPNDVKQMLAREIQVPPLTQFSAVQAIITGAVTRTKRDVESWRIAGQRFFAVDPS